MIYILSQTGHGMLELTNTTYLPPDQKYTESLFDLVTNQGIVCKQPNGYYLQMELTEGIISTI